MMKSLWNSTILLFIFLISFQACQKDHDANPNPVAKDTELSSDEIDSLKYYVWKINLSDKNGDVPWYFWEDQVPSDFNWKNPDYKTGEDVLDAIASYPELNGEKLDRYSFLDMQGTVSNELVNGVLGDYGFSVGLALDQNSDKHLFVEFVYKDSPADQAGIKRGDEIVGINGDSHLNFDDNSISKALFQSESVSLSLRKRGSNSVYDADLKTNDYHLNPVLFDSVYTVGSHKVGYMVYNSFVSVGDRGNGADARDEISSVFGNFETKGVNDLIVDLRYNGGGAVNTSEYLDNLIAPSSALGKEMYNYQYNQPLADYFNSSNSLKEQYLSPVKFSQVSHHLNLNRVFFIVSGSTASASELTINNLKPYMDVKLVGTTTYGKPVGFFTVPIEFKVASNNNQVTHVADMYAINFKTLNSAGQSDYFFGMDPDVMIYDYIDLDWGDSNDPRLASIFSYISGNGFLTQDDIDAMGRKRSGGASVSTPGEYRKMPVPNIQNPHAFNGMVDYRMSKEK